MSKYIRHPSLPKSSLISVKRYKHGWWFHTVRIANAREFWLFRRFDIVIRRQWLSAPGKQLYPELFSDSQEAAQ